VRSWSHLSSTVFLGASLLVLPACTSHHSASLGKDCATVFRSAAPDAEGSCRGQAGTVHVVGFDCKNGPRFMLAEDSGGGDVAWARVGATWHLLPKDGSSSAAFRTCTGD
jgi:hypothetical protein